MLPSTPNQRRMNAMMTYRQGTRIITATKKEPSISTMNKWVCDGIAKATDGCRIEPDGECEHGHVSWLIVLGYI